MKRIKRERKKKSSVPSVELALVICDGHSFQVNELRGNKQTPATMVIKNKMKKK